MAEHSVRMIILSGNLKLKSTIAAYYQNTHTIEVISNAYSVTQLSTLCLKGRKNIVIFDSATATNVEGYLKSLSEKFNVLIITLVDKISGTHPASYKKELYRPAVDNNTAIERFISDLSVHIKYYLSSMPAPTVRNLSTAVDSSQKIIAIAASTGGTEAVLEVLRKLPADAPPVLIVQHMPQGFTKLYADRITKLCSIDVLEATDGAYLKPGLALIAPGDFHMRLTVRSNKLCVDCFYSEKVHGVRPAADILFSSIAPIMGRNVIGVILTGMGSDGAKGLYEMHLKGAHTIGQDKDSCIVYGMPKVAFDIGAVDKQLPLDKIGDYIMSQV